MKNFLKPETKEAGLDQSLPWNLARPGRLGFQVTPYSLWGDLKWTADNLTPGTTSESVIWDFELPDGSCFADPQWEDLLEQFRIVVFSLLYAPVSGKAIKVGSLGWMTVGLYFFVRWMVRRNYHDLGELDRDAESLFLEDLAAHLSDGPDEDLDNAAHRAGIRLRMWLRIWENNRNLNDAGYPGLRFTPFGGRAAKNVAQDIAGEVERRIPPLPDEVALPIMSAASKMIREPAEDVIRATSMFLDVYEAADGSRRTVHAKLQPGYKKLAKFKFSVPEGDLEPWHKSFAEMKWVRGVSISHTLRKLIFAVRDAAGIVIQSETGIRVSELCGLTVVQEDKSLPPGITMRVSATGLNELYFLKGRLAKLEEVPVSAEWLIGSRPRGAEWIPEAVSAVDVLWRLFEPWRARAVDPEAQKTLSLHFSSNIGLPRDPSLISPILSSHVQDGQREFIDQYVSLVTLPDRSKLGEDLKPYKSSSKSIRTHQWRKTFAIFCIRVDSRMTSSIAQQFHHLSLAMTEEHYIGNDPTLMVDMDSARIQEAARFFYERATGRSPALGRMAELIEKHLDEIKSVIQDRPEPEALAELERWCLRHDFRIWFNEGGKCCIGLSPLDAKCHEAAGTSTWKNRTPSFRSRSPSTCVGCRLFAIDRDHIAYWERRHQSNSQAWNSVVGSGKQRGYRVLKERASQAEAILNALSRREMFK